MDLDSGQRGACSKHCIRAAARLSSMSASPALRFAASCTASQRCCAASTSGRPPAGSLPFVHGGSGGRARHERTEQPAGGACGRRAWTSGYRRRAWTDLSSASAPRRTQVHKLPGVACRATPGRYHRRAYAQHKVTQQGRSGMNDNFVRRARAHALVAAQARRSCAERRRRTRARGWS